MKRPATAEASTPETTPRPGIFLPSMIWATDHATVAAEKERLLPLHERLNALMQSASPSDECATWHMMADASLCQLDQDIDALFNWLEQVGETRKGD